MKKQIFPSIVKGSIDAPPSKSYTQRAIAVASLTSGTTHIINPSCCNDSKAAIQIAKNLGAEIHRDKNSLKIKGNINLKSVNWNCLESGLSMRMFSPIAALFDREITITGEKTLLKRPVSMIVDSLMKAGVSASSNNSFPPIKIKGPVKTDKIITDGSISSQFVTGLLIALPLFKNNPQIQVNNLMSRPYIDMTLDLQKQFGVYIENTDYKTFELIKGQKYKPINFTVEGDWSHASFFLVAAAINGRVKINNLSTNSLQADKQVIYALQQVGAEVQMEHHSMSVKHAHLNNFCFDASQCPDLFPPLVVLAGYCNGISEIKGVHRLKHKESDRAKVLQQEFSKLGFKIKIKDDSMFIQGSEINGGVIASHNDHRIAMASAVAALNAKKPVIIENSECITKSYPDYFKDFSNLGLAFNDVE